MSRPLARLAGALALVLSVLFAAHPHTALATTITFANGGTAELSEVDGTITGKAEVSLAYKLGPGGTGFNVTLPDGSTLTGLCISPKHYIPLDGTYSFTASPDPDSKGAYNVTVWASSSQGHHPLSSEDDIDPPQDVGKMRWSPKYAGRFTLRKRSTLESLSGGNACYSLAGAVYGIFSDAACTNQVGSLETNEEGTATSGLLAAGSYWVKELSASSGYALDREIHKVDVTASMTADVTASTMATLSVGESPQYGVPSLLLRKVDADGGTATPQGAGSLEGATYTVNFYAGHYELDGLPDGAAASWVMRTDADGRITFDTDHLVSGSFFTNSAGEAVFPLGTYTFTELSAPEGYVSSSGTTYLAHVSSSGTDERVSVDVTQTDAEAVQRGGVKTRKRDAESQGPHPLGSGSFAGIEFQIVNQSPRAVVVDGASYQPGSVCATIVTDESGEACTAADALPYGSYLIRETGHGRGYFANSAWSQTFRISHDGEMVDLEDVGVAVEDQIRRGDISLTKHDGSTGAIMAGVPFLLTSLSTGEAHVLVTDENGMLSTSSSWNAHTDRTNANDSALSRDEAGNLTVDSSRLDDTAGIWFGQATLDDGSTTITPADDGLGALPYDRTADGGGYQLTELPCAANMGRKMIETTFSVTRDGIELELGTFDDEAISIATTLTGPEGSHLAPAADQLTLTDEVSYDGLTPGQTYHLAAELHGFDAAGTDLGVIASSGADFVALDRSGSTPVVFTFDARALTGKKAVAYETLSLGSRVLAQHADPDDDEQTVYFPSISTMASGEQTSGKDVAARQESSVVDVVSYEGLEPGPYELSASLHLVGEDGSDAGAVAESSTEFRATASDGSTLVRFENVDLTPYAGHKLVVFETLLRDGEVWATHEEADNPDQTVLVPSIQTSASGSHEGGGVAVADGERIVDCVAYDNLLPDTNYQLIAHLHVVWEDEGELVDGGVIAACDPIEFTTPSSDQAAISVSGSVDVEIMADLSEYAGARLVVFEELSRDGQLLATHEDLADQGQTLLVPDLRTTATSADDHDVWASEDRVITDRVSYENLIPGLTYTIEGHLMGFSSDTSAPQELKTVRQDFVPEQANGSIDLVFDHVSLADLAGGKVVAYETLLQSEATIAVHANPSDEDQTVFVPKIRTLACGASGTHTALAGSDQTITDHVSYTNLLPNHTYTATASLHKVGRGLLGQTVDAGACSDTVSVTFTTPEASDGASAVSGTVDVTITTYLEDLASSDIVCFERLSRDDVTVATHEDPSDEDQTVHIPRLNTQADPKELGEAGVVTIVDHISYENLTPGESYEVMGALHKKNPDGSDGGVLSAADGSLISSHASFVADKGSGSIDVEMSVDTASLGLAGSSVVVFEELRQNDVIVARHSDISSTSQLVTFSAKGKPGTSPHRIAQTGEALLPYLGIGLGALVMIVCGFISSRRYR